MDKNLNYRNHVQEIRARLDEYQIDAVLCTHEANRFYAAGFHSSGTDGAALITRLNSYYLTDGRYIEAAGKALESAFELHAVRADRKYTDILKELFEAENIKRVGFEDAYMTVEQYKNYCEKLPEIEFVPAADLLKNLRRVKDQEEIKNLKAAQRIAEKALQDILKEIRPGVSEREIAARIEYLLLHYGAENKSFDPIVVSGANGSLPHGVPSDKIIKSGEFVTMDFGCIFHGYCSDMTRTVAVGEVSDKMREIYNIVLNAQTAGINAVHAGVTGQEIDAAAREVIRAAGYGEYFSHSFGHGVGIEIHEEPYAASSNKNPMPAGAVISAEPGVYIPGELGVRIEDVIIITENGCENLTAAPKDLLVLPV